MSSQPIRQGHKAMFASRVERTTSNPSCPVCGIEMRKANKPRGGSGRSHSFSSQEQGFVCSVDEREVYQDEKNHYQRIEGAKHGPGIKHYTADQLERTARRLSNDEYAASVRQITATCFHVASSTKPSSVREVVERPDGALSCSCPARTASCVHRAAVVEFLTPIEIRITAPCSCCGCHPTDPNPYGCIDRAKANDFQAVTR